MLEIVKEGGALSPENVKVKVFGYGVLFLNHQNIPVCSGRGYEILVGGRITFVVPKAVVL
jgi:hypothetical protein